VPEFGQRDEASAQGFVAFPVGGQGLVQLVKAQPFFIEDRPPDHCQGIDHRTEADQADA
jgi:hypothetical protein